MVQCSSSCARVVCGARWVLPAVSDGVRALHMAQGTINKARPLQHQHDCAGREAQQVPTLTMFLASLLYMSICFLYLYSAAGSVKVPTYSRVAISQVLQQQGARGEVGVGGGEEI